MLNVSCQKQHSSFLAASLRESFMEFIGQPRPSGTGNLLGVPVVSSWDVDDDEGEVVISIRPKSSPLPRRKSSVSDEDSEPEPPVCGSRRVSFADAKGLNLVQVKEFDTWDVPKLPGYDSSDGEGKDEDEYILLPLNFSLPLLTEELFAKVQEQKVELEKIDLLPGTTILKGMVRVLNISFTKAVYIRISLDDWSSHFDLLAEYISCSTDGLTDCFSFTLTLWPPFGEGGARVDFCLRYETPVGTFWANNNNKNYVLSCSRRTKEEKEKPQKENVNKKSCLKTASQNSSVENVSGKESPTQGNASADASNKGLEVGTLKSKSETSGISEEQQLLIESRMNSSQRSRRKAARMVRVRDYFAQRNGGTNNTDRAESPPIVTPAAQEESQKEKHADVQLYPERNRKSEGSQFVAESQVTCSEPPFNVSSIMSPAHDCASKSEPEKSESLTSAASAALAEGESAADIQDNLFEKFAQAEQKHTKCQASSQDRDMGREYISCTAAMNNESLVNQTNNFTFGTVLAPLYHQVFGRVGSESQSRGDWGNPARVTRHGGDLSPHTDRRQISCTVSTDIRRNNSKIQGNGINNPATPSNPHAEEDKEEGAHLGVIVNVVTLQDPAGSENTDQGSTNTLQGSKPCLEDTLSHPETLNILSQTVLLNPQITAESLHLQGEAQEDSVTHDLQSQITAETTQCRLPESARTHNKMDPDEAHAQSNTHEVRISPQTSFASLESSRGAMGRVIEEPDRENSSREEKHHECVELIKDHFPGNTTLKEDELFEDLCDLYSYHVEDSVTKATVSGCELVEKSDFTTAETFLEARGETANVEERSKMAHSSLKDESKPSGEIEVPGELAECVAKETPEKIEHCKIKAAEEGFCLGVITEVKNWEMMVEEEEKNMLIYEEKSETVYLKPDDTKVRGKEIALRANEELVEGIAVTGANEGKEWTRQENLGETVGGEDGSSTEREYAKVTKMGRRGGEDKLTEETEVQKTEGPEETELQKEKHFAGKEVSTQEVSNGRARDQEGEETKGERKTEINFNNGGGNGAESEKKTKEGEREEQKTDCKEETLNCEAEGAEIVGVDACVAKEERKDKVANFEERSDMAQSKDEDILSALVSSGQERGSERVSKKENTGEGQNAHIQTESHHYKVEGFQSNKDATQDQSQDENEPIAAERDNLTDEAESDLTNHDSASAESDSDDEVELYMHCLRAVGAGAGSHKDKGKDTGFTVSKRPCVSRAKLLSATMPSISESQDEEQHLSRLQEKHEDPKTAAVAPPSASRGRGSIGQNILLWRDKFSSSHITKSLLYATLLVVFVVVAYHFDFLACLGLYLISVVWLCCREEKQPIKDNTES